jgi:hypothetical protein
MMKKALMGSIGTDTKTSHSLAVTKNSAPPPSSFVCYASEAEFFSEEAETLFCVL